MLVSGHMFQYREAHERFNCFMDLLLFMACVVHCFFKLWCILCKTREKYRIIG